jgi:hypothetical protein
VSGPAAGFRLEVELLICCARTRADAACAERIRMLVSEDLDWPYLFAAAAEHGVAPLLYHQLSAHCMDAVPSLWMERLRQAVLQNTRHNLLLTAELFRILEACQASSIPAIPYKGPALAEQAYGNVAFRQFSDLDIIVRHRDISGIYALMNKLGYEAHLILPPASQIDQRIPGQYVFTRDAGRILAEIHTERTLRYFPIPLDMDDLIGRLEPIPICGRSLLTFSVEDALPLLCVHASKHFWERISWIADIAELVQIGRRVEWELVVTRASSLGAERMLLLGLHLANDVLNAPLPERVFRRVQGDRAVRFLGDYVRRQLSDGVGETPPVAQRAAFRLRMRGSYWSGIAYMLRLAMAPTEEDWSHVRLKGPFSPLYAALRPFRLLRKYGLGIFGGPSVGRKSARESSAEPTDPAA